MKNKFKELSDTYEYAIGHGMNPFDASTWTGDYKKKLKSLLNSIHDIDEEFNRFKRTLHENSEHLEQH